MRSAHPTTVALGHRHRPTQQTLREALRTADDETAARIVDAVRTALVERVEHDEVRLSAAAFIVSAHA